MPMPTRAKMAPSSRDPFAPPNEADGGEAPLELAHAPIRPAPAAQEEPEVIAPRERVVYKKPPGGAGNFMVWAFAGVGVLALVVAGAKMLKRGVEGAPAVGPAAAATAPPPKPVTWTEVEKGDAVLITVKANIKKAQILIDGEPMVSNPVHLDRGTTHLIQAVAEGYTPAEREITVGEPTTIQLKLSKPKRKR